MSYPRVIFSSLCVSALLAGCSEGDSGSTMTSAAAPAMVIGNTITGAGIPGSLRRPGFWL